MKRGTKRHYMQFIYDRGGMRKVADGIVTSTATKPIGFVWLYYQLHRHAPHVLRRKAPFTAELHGIGAYVRDDTGRVVASFERTHRR